MQGDMKKTLATSRLRGFSLAEVIAAVTIGAMVLVAMLGIYQRAQSSAAAITQKLDSSQLPFEVLQRIAEDLDRVISSRSNMKFTIENKFVKGYPAARMTIVKTYTPSKGGQAEFEKIIWQSAYDYDANGLVLYRSHSGVVLEDKLLDEKRADLERYYPLVPICSGVTYFRIEIPKGEDFLDKWDGFVPPYGIVVTISFAEPFETVQGTLDVPEEDKITRVMAIDRTRKIRFVIVERKFDEEGLSLSDQEEDKQAEEATGEEATAEEETIADEGEKAPAEVPRGPGTQPRDKKPPVRTPDEKPMSRNR